MARKQQRHPARGGVSKAAKQKPIDGKDTAKFAFPAKKSLIFLHPETAPWQVDDAAWFRRHPSRSFRLRPITAAEFPDSMADSCNHILVRQRMPGYRERRPLFIPGNEPWQEDDNELMLLWQYMATFYGGDGELDQIAARITAGKKQHGRAQ